NPLVFCSKEGVLQELPDCAVFLLDGRQPKKLKSAKRYPSYAMSSVKRLHAIGELLHACVSLGRLERPDT
ncbi:MAG: hypothetical protein IJ682_13900, partial [Lachnospiraceae bacterium]|nr:hypothetical protein [Lachnospiraceae bacterium]